jgi:hypothetical protein
VEEQDSEEAEEEEADDENKLGSTSALSAPPIPLLALGYKNRCIIYSLAILHADGYFT